MHTSAAYAIGLGMAAVASAASLPPPSLRIDWAPCVNDTEKGIKFPPRVQCATLSVPLDYTDKKSDARTLVELNRLPAAKTPSKGSILVNFGGPGQSGTKGLIKIGEVMQAATGGIYDLINMVPRGTGKAPNLIFTSKHNQTSGNRTLAGSRLGAGNSSDSRLVETWDKATRIAERYAAGDPVNGTLIGTAFVARDLMQVVDALDEDGMLRYWGISYGTVLGATIASMFPDRVDRMLLDAVKNPFEYYHNRWVEFLDKTDETLRGFCEGCVSVPENCTLAEGRTAQEVEDAIISLLNKTKHGPQKAESGGQWILPYGALNSHVRSMLYRPANWPVLAETLSASMNGSLNIVKERLERAASASKHSQGAYFGIRCGDNVTPNRSFDDSVPIAESYHERSPILGDDSDRELFVCSQWKLRAKERYDGNFKVQTRNPILLVGNSFDPTTPLVSARNVSKTFEGSVVLEQKGYGHGSLAQASLCTAKAIRRYFVNGMMPEEGEQCDVDVELFSGTDGWNQVLPQLD